jgi:hypothetical protein
MRVRKIVKIDSERRRICPSVNMEQLISRWTDFHENSYLGICFRKSVENVQDSLKSEKKTGTLHEDQYTFYIISSSVLLRMKNVSDKYCREKSKYTFYN